MRMLLAPITPDAVAESEQLMRASLVVHVRIREGLPENGHWAANGTTEVSA